MTHLPKIFSIFFMCEVGGQGEARGEQQNYSNGLEYSQKGFEWDGFYVQGSYLLTGETRGYKWKGAIFDKIKPKGKMGAVEFVLRYEDISIDDADEGTVAASEVDVDRTVVGVNWYVCLLYTSPSPRDS